MTDLEKIIAMLEEMKDIVAREVDPEKGKSFWPIKEDDRPNINDAYKTLYDLSNAELCLTFYDETGNILTDELCIDFSNCWVSPDDVGSFARRPLKEMLEEELQIYIDEDNQDCKPARLLARLIGCFDDRG